MISVSSISSSPVQQGTERLINLGLCSTLIEYSSEQSRKDCETIVGLGLKAKILTHVRCNMEDARLAVATGVDGVDVVVRLLLNHETTLCLLMIVPAIRSGRRLISESILTEKTCPTSSRPPSRSLSAYLALLSGPSTD